MLLALLLHVATAQVEVIERTAATEDAADLVVVASPLLPFNADDALRRHRGRLRVVQLDRPVVSEETIVDALRHIDVSGATVVAFGAGATLALQAGWTPDQWLLVAPLIAGIPTQATHDALSPSEAEHTRQARQLLVGALPNAWTHTTTSLRLDTVLLGQRDIPLPGPNGLVLVSAGDELATVESTIPRAHDAGLPVRRIGLGGWTRRDLPHAQVWTSAKGQRAIRRALRILRRSS